MKHSCILVYDWTVHIRFDSVCQRNLGRPSVMVFNCNQLQLFSSKHFTNHKASGGHSYKNLMNHDQIDKEELHHHSACLFEKYRNVVSCSPQADSTQYVSSVSSVMLHRNIPYIKAPLNRFKKDYLQELDRIDFRDYCLYTCITVQSHQCIFCNGTSDIQGGF